MDISLAIEMLIPAAQYGGSLTDNTQEAFDALQWTDERTKPTWDAVQAVTIAPVFAPVTPRQIRLAINQLGLRSAIEAYVANADQDTKDSWQYSTQFERTNPMLVNAAIALGQPSSAVDALFTLAATL